MQNPQDRPRYPGNSEAADPDPLRRGDVPDADEQNLRRQPEDDDLGDLTDDEFEDDDETDDEDEELVD